MRTNLSFLFVYPTYHRLINEISKTSIYQSSYFIICFFQSISPQKELLLPACIWCPVICLFMVKAAYLYKNDCPLFIYGRQFIISYFPLIISVHSLYNSNRPLCILDSPLCISNRLIIISGSPLMISGSPLFKKWCVFIK